jgi:hypothetical protein
MEDAIAETAAMKWALVTFGDQFGLTRYDREQRNAAATRQRSARACGASDRLLEARSACARAQVV